MAETERPDGLAGAGQAGRSVDLDALYVAGTPARDIGWPQSAFRELAERGRLVGQVLDVGCGTGEHAPMAAALGLDATGLDAATTAIAIRKADERGRTADFMTGNALELADLGQSFDTVLDCGLFHVFEDSDRPNFVAGLRTCMPAGARYYMLCFSDHEPGDWGPRRIRQDEIRLTFGDGWLVEAIEASMLEITIDPGSARAWLASILREGVRSRPGQHHRHRLRQRLSARALREFGSRADRRRRLNIVLERHGTSSVFADPCRNGSDLVERR